MHRVICDQCGGDVALSTGIEVVYPALDDDGDLYGAEADLCSWSCLLSWSVSMSVDAERPGV